MVSLLLAANFYAADTGNKHITVDDNGKLEITCIYHKNGTLDLTWLDVRDLKIYKKGNSRKDRKPSIDKLILANEHYFSERDLHAIKDKFAKFNIKHVYLEVFGSPYFIPENFVDILHDSTFTIAAFCRTHIEEEVPKSNTTASSNFKF